MALQIVNITSLTLIEIITLPKRERLVFVALFISRNFRTHENWTYYKTHEELADILDVKTTSIRNAIISLQSKGWLSTPETRIVPDPELLGRRIKQYRWRFPKHETEFAHAKANIAEINKAREEKRDAAKQAVNGKNNKDEHVTELTPNGLNAFADVFNSS